MRRMLIRYVMPPLFCTLPILGALLVVAALPPQARDFYRSHISSIDWLILGLGTALFLAQLFFALRALRWRGTTFDERPDRWLSALAQGAEWFPLLGLLGTVAAILQTFSAFRGRVSPETIIVLFAPAITATGSGLFAALLNILPPWIVIIGREVILTLAGGPAPNPPPPAVRQPAETR